MNDATLTKVYSFLVIVEQEVFIVKPDKEILHFFKESICLSIDDECSETLIIDQQE